MWPGFLSHNLTNTHLLCFSIAILLAEARSGGLLSTLRWQYFERSTLLFVLLAILTTKNFVRGRRAFCTGEQTHHLISNFQGKASATVNRTGNPDGQCPECLSKTPIFEGGFPHGQHSPLLLSPTWSSPQDRGVLVDFQREGNAVLGTPGYWYEAQW